MVQKSLKIPNIRALVDAILGKPYEEYRCWPLVRYLLKEGFALDIEANPEEAAHAVMEVWFMDDARDICAVVQPWDWLIIAGFSHISTHVCLVVDTTWFVHTRRSTGVVLERLQRWQPHILQLARLRMLV